MRNTLVNGIVSPEEIYRIFVRTNPTDSDGADVAKVLIEMGVLEAP